MTDEPSFGQRVLRALVWRARRVGIHISIFVIVRESVSFANPFELAEGFRLVRLTEADVDELLALNPDPNRQEIAGLFDSGKLCFGLRYGPTLVAKMWCDLAEFSAPVARRPLTSQEAYLFSAYTARSFRGRNLAPTLRSACYAELRAMGRTHLLSYTEYFNSAARRFKTKLGAVEEDLIYVHVELLNKWSKTWPVRRRARRVQ